MSTDPNGSRWSSSDRNFGKALLKKSGWTEGTGLGKEQDGIVSHVKVTKKDDVMGLGYQAGVQDTWTTQSVGFADVLTRIKASNAAVISGSDGSDGSDADSVGSPTSSSPTTNGEAKTIGVSRHYKMYAKRNALKTELLRGADSADGEAKRLEILGSAASKHRREDDEEGGSRHGHKHARVETDVSTLKSPLLARVMARNTKEEPKPSTDDMSPEERIAITKPNPRPPKCTDTPFLAS